jgi:hypothetical protein
MLRKTIDIRKMCSQPQHGPSGQTPCHNSDLALLIGFVDKIMFEATTSALPCLCCCLLLQSAGDGVSAQGSQQ